MKMFSGLLCCLAVAAMTLLTGTATNAATVPSKKTAAQATSARLTTTVTAVDYTNRIITFKVNDGTLVEIEVSPTVKNLKQVKVGDRVTLDYLDTMALTVKKAGGDKSARTASETVQVALHNQKPIKLKMRVMEVTATVDAINHENRVANLRLPNGIVQSYFIPRHVKNLETVKKGDQVTVRYTKAICIRISKSQ